MLIEFRVKNFRSFNEEQVFSMVAAKDDSLPGNVVEVGKWRLLRTAAIYGANASGKSNLVKAFETMADMVQSSADKAERVRNALVPFALNPMNTSLPCSFEVTFLLDNIRYQYGFTSTRKRIHDEWLLYYPTVKARTLFRRVYDSDTQETEWSFGRYLEGQKEALRSKSRDDALFLSVAAQWNHRQLTPLYQFLASGLRTMPTGERLRQVTAEMWDADADAERGGGTRQGIVAALASCDFGISGLTVEPIEFELPDLPDTVPDSAREALAMALRSKGKYDVKMLHQTGSEEPAVPIPLHEESDGTQRFFQLIGPMFETVASNYTVVIDELERSLHPFLVRELIRWIQELAAPITRAQLVFSTHDTTLLDPDLLRRDQVWFTEKDSDGATHLYSLSDYEEENKGKARKDEAFQKRYLEGRYGAIPIIERFELSEPTQA